MDTLNPFYRAEKREPPPMPKGREPEASTRNEQKIRWFLLVGAVALVCIFAARHIAARHIRVGEFDFNVDEAQHAVTGLFVAHALHDLPLRHPVQYANTYYAQYPAVAILHWPPLFYLFEGASFILFGATAASARLTVIFFTVYRAAFWTQVGFYGFSFLGFSGWKLGPLLRLSDIAYTFVALNAAALVAFSKFITGQKAVWMHATVPMEVHLR